MKKLETKFDEVIITTSKVDEMKGKYIAERLLRTWKEDFVDEDTSEVVAIERNEIIFEKGAFLSPDNLSQINFMLQSEDIKEVTVSNQKREAVNVNGSSSVWLVSVLINTKSKSHLYLYANSVEMAMNVSTDYLEQKYSGFFKYVNIKELDYFTLLSTKEEEEDEALKNDKELHFYKIEVDVIDLTDDYNYQQIFFLKAQNAEDAKTKILVYLTDFREDNDLPNPFELKTLSAKTIKCDNVIDMSFSEAYFDKENE
jgi:hypothetical protein